MAYLRCRSAWTGRVMLCWCEPDSRGASIPPLDWTILEDVEEGAKMAGRVEDRGPWTVMARHTPDGTEQRIGLHDDLDAAVQHADDVVDAGLWHDANVYDREQRNVHQAVKKSAERVEPEGNVPPPAA